MTRRNDGDMTGGVTMPREPMFYGTVPGTSGSASFSGSVSNISARYTGKACVYAVRARCDSCLEGQVQLPTGTAHGHDREIEAGGEV